MFNIGKCVYMQTSACTVPQHNQIQRNYLKFLGVFLLFFQALLFIKTLELFLAKFLTDQETEIEFYSLPNRFYIQFSFLISTPNNCLCMHVNSCYLNACGELNFWLI